MFFECFLGKIRNKNELESESAKILRLYLEREGYEGEIVSTTTKFCNQGELTTSYCIQQQQNGGRSSKDRCHSYNLVFTNPIVQVSHDTARAMVDITQCLPPLLAFSAFSFSVV